MNCLGIHVDARTPKSGFKRRQTPRKCASPVVYIGKLFKRYADLGRRNLCFMPGAFQTGHINPPNPPEPQSLFVRHPYQPGCPSAALAELKGTQNALDKLLTTRP